MLCYKNQKSIMKIINEYQRIRFHNMSNEKKDRLNEYHRMWYSKLDYDKKNKLRKKALGRHYLIKVC